MSGNIKVDNQFINSNMDEIAAIAKNYTDTPSDSYSSTTLTPSAEPDVLQKMLLSCKEVFEKITRETEAIKEIGDTFESLDIDMSNLATELNMTVESTAAAPVALITTEPQTGTNIDELTESYQEINDKYQIEVPEPEPEPTQPGTSSGGGSTGGSSGGSSGGSDSGSDSGSDEGSTGDNDDDSSEGSDDTSTDERETETDTDIDTEEPTQPEPTEPDDDTTSPEPAPEYTPPTGGGNKPTGGGSKPTGGGNKPTGGGNTSTGSTGSEPTGDNTNTEGTESTTINHQNENTNIDGGSDTNIDNNTPETTVETPTSTQNENRTQVKNPRENNNNHTGAKIAGIVGAGAVAAGGIAYAMHNFRSDPNSIDDDEKDTRRKKGDE